MKRQWITILLVAGLASAGCGDRSKDEVGMGQGERIMISDDELAGLNQGRYFFGHQSVGKNILDGIAAVQAQEPSLALKIVKNPTPGSVEPGTVAHAYVGGNGDPHDKLADFVTELDSGLAQAVDVAMIKFCYLDFTPGTDAAAVFEHYRDTLASLQVRYPELTIVHMTVPLRPLQTGPKAWLKSVLGKPLTGREDNLVKHRYNELMRAHYAGQEPLFDIAAIESTRTDGRCEEAAHDGEKFEVMVPQYTDDDGHLNRVGSRVVAVELLRFLAGLSE